MRRVLTELYLQNCFLLSDYILDDIRGTTADIMLSKWENPVKMAWGIFFPKTFIGEWMIVGHLET